jgi:hypothetical protein
MVFEGPNGGDDAPKAKDRKKVIHRWMTRRCSVDCSSGRGIRRAWRWTRASSKAFLRSVRVVNEAGLVDLRTKKR